MQSSLPQSTMKKVSSSHSLVIKEVLPGGRTTHTHFIEGRQRNIQTGGQVWHLMVDFLYKEPKVFTSPQCKSYNSLLYCQIGPETSSTLNLYSVGLKKGLCLIFFHNFSNLTLTPTSLVISQLCKSKRTAKDESYTWHFFSFHVCIREEQSECLPAGTKIICSSLKI